MNATIAALPSRDGVTVTGSLRPSSSRPSVLSVSIAAWVAGWSASVTTTWSWSSEPCGHFSLSRLMPATPSIVAGNAVMSVVPVRSCRTGTASRIRNPADRMVIGIGRAITHVTSRPQNPLPSCFAARWSSQARADRPQRLIGPSGRATASRGSQAAGRPRLTRSPRIARVAGRNVRLPTTDTATTEMVPTAIEVNSETPRVMRPASEIMTAIPEKKTARPAVLLEISIDLALSRPARRSTRKRVIMNSE